VLNRFCCSKRSEILLQNFKQVDGQCIFLSKIGEIRSSCRLNLAGPYLWKLRPGLEKAFNSSQVIFKNDFSPEEKWLWLSKSKVLFDPTLFPDGAVGGVQYVTLEAMHANVVPVMWDCWEDLLRKGLNFEGFSNVAEAISKINRLLKDKGKWQDFVFRNKAFLRKHDYKVLLDSYSEALLYASGL